MNYNKNTKYAKHIIFNGFWCLVTGSLNNGIVDMMRDE